MKNSKKEDQVILEQENVGKVILPQVKKKSRYIKLNASQKLTNKIRKHYLKIGVILTYAEVRFFKKEWKLVRNMTSIGQLRFYLKNFIRTSNSRHQFIMLMALTPVLIKGKLDMPGNVTDYKERAVAMAEVQTLNVSGYFTTAFTGLALLNTRITALDAATKAEALHNGTGSAGAVATAKANVRLSLNLLMVYINGLAAANQAAAVAIITAALCIVTKARVSNKQDFAVKNGIATGTVKLISLAAKIDGKRVPTTYRWQWGLMVAGIITWVDLPSTPTAKTIATGMPTGVQVFFRKAITTVKGGVGCFGAPLNTMPS